MAVAFTRISWWLWGGGAKEGEGSGPGGSPGPLSASFDFGLGFREPETVKFSTSKARGSSSRRSGRRKWQSREQRRIDREFDVVLVPPDAGCLSGSESEDSDWSIGWLEPHAADFGAEGENSFAVLVQCYGRGRAERVEEDEEGEGIGNGVLGVVDLADSADDRKYMEELLSALQSS